ncbi:MAG: IS30 family transposase [bacterium]|nr:IS30 family transposase [bacterium]
MERQKGTTTSRKGKHLNYNERIVIEKLLKAGLSKAQIAKELERSYSTIRREVANGTVEHLNSDLTSSMVYNADRAQDVHNLNASAKGAPVKLLAGRSSVLFISYFIRVKRWSPEVVAARMKEKGMPDALCSKSIYNYIDQGWIPGVSNETLWEKRLRRKNARKTLRRQPPKAPQRRKNIDERPDEVEARVVFGHWEIDLVVGGKDGSKEALMTLTERKTRLVRVRKLKDRTQASVLKALRSMESAMGTRAFRAVFKSITADNGTEFLDVESMEKSAFSNQKRTQLYYAHPYASWERGSNENGNRMIRRFIPKGADIADYNREKIREIQNWINGYPRKILQFKTAEEMFNLELAV